MAGEDGLGPRLSAVGGVLFTVFACLGLILPGAPPKADDSLREIVTFLTDKRDSILAGDAFLGLGVAAFLLFAGGLQRHLRATARNDDGLRGSPFAVFFGAAAWAGARSGAFPDWLPWFGGLVALLQILAGIGLFAKSGFFATGGAMGFITPLLSLAWVLAVSVLLFRTRPARRPSSAG